jgi:hypothetical protein
MGGDQLVGSPQGARGRLEPHVDGVRRSICRPFFVRPAVRAFANNIMPIFACWIGESAQPTSQECETPLVSRVGLLARCSDEMEGN